MNVSLIVNPIAGNRAYKSIHSIESLLKNRVSYNMCITKKQGDAYEFAKNLTQTDRILIASGDGTINEVINGLLHSNITNLASVPLALIPLGTTNVLAKDRGIPENIEQAVDLALTGQARKISLGRINGRYFTLMAGIGLDAEAVRGVRNGFIKTISGKAAHVFSGLKALSRYHPPLITVKTPGGEISGYTAVVGNAKNYGGYFYITPEASITKPELDICVFGGRTRTAFLRFVSMVIQNKHLQHPDVSYTKDSEMEITADGTVHVQIDGDYFGTLPVKIDVVQDAVSLIWPGVH